MVVAIRFLSMAQIDMFEKYSYYRNTLYCIIVGKQMIIDKLIF